MKLFGNRSGISLLELILALLFISIAFFSAYYVFTASLVVDDELEGDVVAMNLANLKLEQMLNQSFDSMVNEPKTAVAGFNGYYRQVTVTSQEANLKKIEIVVYWNVNGQEINYKIASMRSAY
ncbi:MAG: hypothetical protein ABIA63_01130 [bacterium]